MKTSGVDVLTKLPESVTGRLRSRQDIVGMALERSNALPREERILVRTVLGAGVAAADLACVAKCRPRALQRRFKRVIQRLGSDSFAFVMRHAERWPAVRRNIAQAVLLQGMTQREAARHLGLTVHVVRKELERIDALRELQSTVEGVRASRALAMHDADDFDGSVAEADDAEQ